MTHHRDVSVMTASGVLIHPFHSPEELAPLVHISDAAHHLSNIARFTGATRRFYSVAQHQVLCARLAEHRFRKHHDSVRPDDTEWIHKSFALLNHDNPEYVLNDLAGPIKNVDPWVREKVSRVDAYLGTGAGGDRHEHLSLSAYHLAEDNLWGAFAIKYRLPHVMPDYVHEIDRALLKAEQWMLMPYASPDIGDIPTFILDELRQPWPSDYGREPYLAAFDRLWALRMEHEDQARAGS